MTGKEAVKYVIQNKGSDYIPMFLYNGDLSKSDVLRCHVQNWYTGEDKKDTEWGFRWSRAEDDKTSMGVPEKYPLKDWSNFDSYMENNMPDAFREDRFAEADAMDVNGRYFFADMHLSGFTVMTLLRGFEELLIDMCEYPDRFGMLADKVFSYECDVARLAKEHGFDGIHFADDWGMQRTMMVSPELWRKTFKERYRDQFKYIHDLGLDVFFHTCGYVYPIIEDLIEIGVDIVNLGQPEINGLDDLRRNFKGKVCFCASINYQTTGLYGTRDEIYAEAKQLIDTFGGKDGRFIAKIFDYAEMGWDPPDPMSSEYGRLAFVEHNLRAASTER